MVTAFMNTALTTQFRTRAIAGVVIVPRNRRMSWHGVMDYAPGGRQGERN